MRFIEVLQENHYKQENNYLVISLQIRKSLFQYDIIINNIIVIKIFHKVNGVIKYIVTTQPNNNLTLTQPTPSHPHNLSNIAIGREDSGTIDRGFSLVESLHSYH